MCISILEAKFVRKKCALYTVKYGKLSRVDKLHFWTTIKCWKMLMEVDCQNIFNKKYMYATSTLYGRSKSRIIQSSAETEKL